MDKKQKEEAILTLIYNKADYAEVVPTEQPDFRIRHHEELRFFGVEVTEFYYSEANARLKNISSYVGEILAENKYRHKDDKTLFAPQEITPISPEGISRGVQRVIIQMVPAVDDYIQMIAAAIRIKEQKFDEYGKDLQHINLIVFDTENRIYDVSANEYYKHLYKETLRNALFETKFQEIFLVTRLDKTRWVYIPLKMGLFVAEFYMFAKVLADHFPKKANLPLNDFMMFFAQYIHHKTNAAFCKIHEDTIQVIWGSSGIAVGKENIQLEDYYDHPIPLDIFIPKMQGVSKFLKGSAFKKRTAEVWQKHNIIASFVYDVKAQVNFT